MNKSVTTELAKLRMPSKFSKSKKLFAAIFFLCLFAATAWVTHLSQGQPDQISPDWTGITHDFFNLSPATTEPVLTASMITDRSNVSYVADPFLFHEGDTWYMFFEVNLDGVWPNLPSDIGLATSSDGFNWTYQQIVLSEPFHLAYPYVFKWNDTYYMVPETFSENAVKLYEATNFPYNWTFVCNLVSGRAYVDSPIFRYDNTWWMYAPIDAGNVYLFYSDNLTDPASWHEHPMSPIVIDKSEARGAGRVITFNGTEIIRLAQNSSVTYGYSVRAFKVDTLNTTSYAEHEISQSPLIEASGSGWNKDGMHQLDPWWIGDRWLAVVDGVTYDPTETWSIGIYESPIAKYQLTISTNYGTVSPPSDYYDKGSNITINATPPVASPGERYVWLGWTGSGNGSYTGMDNPASITMNGTITETAQWRLEYQITFDQAGLDSTANETVVTVDSAPKSFSDLPFSEWIPSGSSVNFEYAGTVSSATVGKQFVLTGVDAASPLAAAEPATVIGTYKTQYYLTVNSTHDTPGGSGWYDSGSTAYATLTDGIVSGGTGTQYVFTNWSTDASGTNYAESDGIVMSDPKTATANWKTQYLVSFAVDPSGAGTTSPSGTNLWEDAGPLSISSTPNSGNTFSSWSSSTESITFTNPSLASTIATISGPGTITANFAINTYAIIASAGDNGTISPSGTVIVNYGDNRTFTITPDSNYHIADVLVDGSSVGAVTSYTFTNVTAGHNITASFAIDTYTITFTETGLTSGTFWSVTFNGVTRSSTATTITFTGVESGSYSWSALTPISSGTGTRYGASTSSGTMSVPTKTSQTITYTIQYYLTANSAHGTASGSDWYNSGATAHATVTPLIVNGSTGTRYVFEGWSGDASGTTASSSPITMNGPKTATATYLTQYYIQVSSTHGNPTASNWVNASDDFEISVESPTDTVPQDHQWVCTGFSLDNGTYQSGMEITLNHVTAPHSVTFAWKEQFWVKFEKTGLPDDVVVNVTVNSANYTLPYSGWFDKGANIAFTYESHLPNGFGAEYVLTSSSAESPIKVDAATQITAQYSNQFTAAMYLAILIPIIIAILVAALLLIRRRRKKQNE